MKQRKNIERLYQEKFKDFEASPKEEAWQHISARLLEKKKKKPVLIPLWYQLGGAAAALALILGLAYFLINPTVNNDIEVVFEIEEAARPSINLPEDNLQFQQASRLLDSVRLENNKGGKTNIAANQQKNSAAAKTQDSHTNEIMAANSKNKASEENVTSNKASDNDKILNTNIIQDNSSAISNAKNEEDKIEEKSSSEENLKDTKPNALAQLAEKKKSEDEEDIIAQEKAKFRLSTFAAPIFYDNLGKGNAISQEFNNNNSEAQVTLAYGMNVAYPINNKISVRTGISKVRISYNIQDIEYAPSAFAQNIESINYANRSPVQVQSTSTAYGLPNFESPTDNNSVNVALSSAYIPGEINQQYGFIEVPLEIEYALIDKKFQLNIIGGGSGLFLDENTISVLANNQRTELGEANNINNLSFSTNIGLGLGYEFLSDFRLNVEPLFKYQLNTFSGTDGVQPFFFGIYSGFSYKF